MDVFATPMMIALMEAEDSQGVIGKALHQRVIMNIEKFMKKIEKYWIVYKRKSLEREISAAFMNKSPQEE